MTEAQAAVADGKGGYAIETVRLAEPGPGEALLRMRSSGVCHTDSDSLRWGRPLILGHEGAGEVLRTGTGVTSCRSGDRVLLNWAIPCGVCFQCARGRENVCENRATVADRSFERVGSAPGAVTTTARNTGSAGTGGFNASFRSGPWPRTRWYPRQQCCRCLRKFHSRSAPFSAARL